MIYLDHAATSFPKINEVQQAVLNCMNTCSNANRSTFQSSLQASRLLYQTRQQVKKLFHVPLQGFVIFNSGNTESLNTCIKGILKKGDHVITTYAEHNSVSRPLYQLQSDGLIQLSITEPKVDKIKKEINDTTKLIIVTHSSNVTGEFYPIKEIGQLAHENQILMMCDVAQSAGHIDVDMVNENIDILCFSGHKGLLGNAGIGGICLSHAIDIEPLLSGGSGMNSFDHFQSHYYPEKLEAGSCNITGIASLNAGISYFLKHREMIYERENKLIKLLEQELKKNDSVILYSDLYHNHAPIVAFNIKGMDSLKVGDLLSEKYQIAVRCGAHCAPLMHQRLNTVKTGIIRVSPAFVNTEEQIKVFIQAIREISEDLK